MCNQYNELRDKLIEAWRVPDNREIMRLTRACAEHKDTCLVCNGKPLADQLFGTQVIVVQE